MELKHKAEFELINNSLWLLLKGYVKDDVPYKRMMSELFTIYMEKDSASNKFSEEWKDSLIDLYNCPERHKANKGVCGFGAELAECFQRYLEHQEHTECSYEDFYRYVSKAFLIEWGRLRNESVSKT